MTDEEIMDKLLTHLNPPPKQTSVDGFIKHIGVYNKTDEHQWYRIQERVIEEGLCKKTGNGLMLTSQGTEVANNGSYLTRLQRTLLRVEHENEKAQMEFDQLKDSRVLTQLQIKDYKLTRALAWVGGGLSVALAIIELIRAFQSD